MGEFTQFKVYQNMTFQNAMIEYKINVEVIFIIAHPFLSCYKAETASKLQQELLQVVNQCLFNVTLSKCGIVFQIEKFQNKRVVNKLLRLQFTHLLSCFCNDRSLILAC